MLENYALKFINSALNVGDALGPLTLMFLFLGRIFPIIALAPFLGARVMPHPVKVCLALSLFVIFLPLLLEQMSGSVTYNHLAIALLIKEVFIGYIIGMIVSLPFTIVQNAGILIDHQRGGASLMVNDPTVQNQSSPLGTLFNMVMICCFYYIDGPFYFFDILIDSYKLIPPDQFLNRNFFSGDTPFWNEIIQLFNKVMILSIQMAMPGLLIILMTDFFLGIANRLAPQVQITFLGMPLKSLLALAIICLGWVIYTDHFASDARTWLLYLKRLISYFTFGQNVSIPP
jgi:type III secretion protein T